MHKKGNFEEISGNFALCVSLSFGKKPQKTPTHGVEGERHFLGNNIGVMCGSKTYNFGFEKMERLGRMS